jgi:hypothetical protein
MTNNHNLRRVFLYRFSAIFILIGIATLLGVIFNPHNFPDTFSGWIGVTGRVVGVLIGLFFLLIFILIIDFSQ